MDVEYLLTVKEARKRLKVGHTRIYELINSGMLPAYKMGRSTRLRPEDVEVLAKHLTRYTKREAER